MTSEWRTSRFRHRRLLKRNTLLCCVPALKKTKENLHKTPESFYHVDFIMRKPSKFKTKQNISYSPTHSNSEHSLNVLDFPKNCTFLIIVDYLTLLFSTPASVQSSSSGDGGGGGGVCVCMCVCEEVLGAQD